MSIARMPPASPTPAVTTPTLVALTRDPRHLQLLALATLLGYGLAVLDFPVTAGQIAVTLAATLGTQWLLTRLLCPGPFEPRSALVSGLSLCLLLRVDALAVAAAVGAGAIASKFLLRWRGHHVFNPTALAIAVAVLASDRAWVSPGQWGHAAAAGLLVAGLGLAVLTRARRLDILVAFLLAWTGALLVRAAWYHDPLAIPLHQLGNGALVLFAFFMITDPRTTPGTRRARVIFAAAVALTGAVLGFGQHRADALILALALCGPLTPLLDRVLAPSPRASAVPTPSPLPTLQGR